jgi:hypothetical protein
MHQVTVVRVEDCPRDNQGVSTVTAASHAKAGPSIIERLQQEIVRLLAKNQTIRFDLLAAQQKLARIEQELFGSETGDLDKLLPPDRIRYLRDLCQTADIDMRFIS